MIREEETHDELLRAFRQYFEANQRWVNQGTRRAGMDSRYWLSEIRRICSRRRDNIMEWRKWLNEETKKAQNQGKESGDSTN
jgi:hypothetical protein